jgi:chromosome segregation ATPase
MSRLLQPVPELPQAIPPPSDDIGEAWKMIGQKEMRIVQLMTRIMEIAAKANEVDDQRIVLEQVRQVLADEVESSRKRIAELETEIAQLRGTIGAKPKRRKK